MASVPGTSSAKQNTKPKIPLEIAMAAAIVNLGAPMLPQILEFLGQWMTSMDMGRFDKGRTSNLTEDVKHGCNGVFGIADINQYKRDVAEFIRKNGLDFGLVDPDNWMDFFGIKVIGQTVQRPAYPTTSGAGSSGIRVQQVANNAANSSPEVIELEDTPQKVRPPSSTGSIIILDSPAKPAFVPYIDVSDDEEPAPASTSPPDLSAVDVQHVGASHLPDAPVIDEPVPSTSRSVRKRNTVESGPKHEQDTPKKKRKMSRKANHGGRDGQGHAINEMDHGDNETTTALDSPNIAGIDNEYLFMNAPYSPSSPRYTPSPVANRNRAEELLLSPGSPLEPFIIVDERDRDPLRNAPAMASDNPKASNAPAMVQNNGDVITEASEAAEELRTPSRKRRMSKKQGKDIVEKEGEATPTKIVRETDDQRDETAEDARTSQKTVVEPQSLKKSARGRKSGQNKMKAIIDEILRNGDDQLDDTAEDLLTPNKTVAEAQSPKKSTRGRKPGQTKKKSIDNMEPTSSNAIGVKETPKRGRRESPRKKSSPSKMGIAEKSGTQAKSVIDGISCESNSAGPKKRGRPCRKSLCSQDQKL